MLNNFFYYRKNGIFIDKGTIIKDSLSCRVEIGEQTRIGRYCLISGKEKIKIGKRTIVEDKVQIISFDHNYENKSQLISKQGLRFAPITIGNDCVIGTGSIILSGSIIPDGTHLPPKTVWRKRVRA